MNKYLFKRSAVLSLLALAFVATPRLAADSPVQVYILMGQSNMVGMGTVGGTTDGTLEYAVYNKGLYPYLDDGGSWSARDDVRHVRVMSSALGSMSVYNNEWMSVASDDNAIGPEYGIGHALGEAIDAPVMVLKSCIGNRSLGWDLLPPGSEQYVVGDYTYAGYGDSPDKWLTGTTPAPISWQAGVQYDGDVRNAKTVLANLNTYFPGATEYEIAGFFFWQGDKDRYSEVYSDRYEQNLVRLIEQLRVEFNAPNANFVCATLGQTVIGATGNDGLILDAQLAVSDAEKYPQFEGNVATVYSNPLSLGGASNGHYNNNAETYMNIGEAMGEAMASLLRTLPYATVDQQTGEIKIVNPADGDIDMAFKDLSIISEMGALVPANWTAITGNYDLAGNRSVDDDGNWTITTATAGELSEAAQIGGGDGLISIAQEISLGVGAWVQNPTKDIQFTYTDANGVSRQLSVRYIGAAIKMADMNFDGTVDGFDWPHFLAGNQADLSALSAAHAYQMGDLDGDGYNDIHDFALFREAFELANPAEGAFEAMIARYQIPEPTSLLLLAAGAAGLGMRRRKGNFARKPRLRNLIGQIRPEEKQMTTRYTSRSLSALAIVAVAALAITAAPAGAEITVDGFDNWISGSSPVSGTFDASVSDKLVVIVTGEHGFNQTANGSISGVTYDGVAMTELINRTTIKASVDPLVLVDDTWNAIYYLDNPGSVYTAGLISATVSSRGSMTVFGLSGTAPGAGNTVIGARDTNSADLTTSADSIVIASYGMGGSGNTAYINNVTVDAPLTFVSKQNNGGGRWWDGHVTAYANGVSAGNATYSVTDTSAPGADGRTGAHLILAEFLPGAPPRNLTFRVDTATGDTSILGDPTRVMTINYYQVTSEGDSLDDAHWSSLADQDFEGNGPPNGTGNGWEEAGGAGKHALAEAFLLGNSTIDAAASINLGRGYDFSVNAQDLAFTYRTDTGAIIEGLVEYISSAIPGDADNNGVVNAADYIALKRHMGQGSGASTAEGNFDGDEDVDWDDLQILLAHYGQASAGASAIPEPATLSLLALLALSLPKRLALSLPKRVPLALIRSRGSRGR